MPRPEKEKEDARRLPRACMGMGSEYEGSRCGVCGEGLAGLYEW